MALPWLHNGQMPLMNYYKDKNNFIEMQLDDLGNSCWFPQRLRLTGN